MAYDKVVDSAVLEAGLTLIGDSIRAKSGTSAKLEFPNGMKAAVDAIDTSENLDDVLTEQESIITEQDALIASMQTALKGKAGGLSAFVDEDGILHLSAGTVNNNILEV